MKPTQITELFANIRKTFVSFFSILMFVALGVGIFLGIIWTAPALQNAAGRVFDEGAFHSFQIQFPYGLTDADLDQLRAVEGVTLVEPARQSFQESLVGGASKTFKVQSIGQEIDKPIVVEGELPTAADQIAVNAMAAKELGIRVGDTVTFAHDAKPDDQSAQIAKLMSGEGLGGDDAAGADGAQGDAAPAQDAGGQAAQGATAKADPGMRYLNGSSFTVTALVNSPEYLSALPASYGLAPTPSGAVDAVAWVVDGAFDASAFYGGWPVVNVSCESLGGLNSFADDYKKASSGIEARIAELGATLSAARYDELTGKVQDAIAKGNKQVEEGKAKIAEGERQAEEGRAQLDKAAADGQAALDDAAQKLYAAQAQYDSGLAKYNEGKARYDEAVSLAETAMAQVDPAIAEADGLKAELESGAITKEQYDARVAALCNSLNASLAPLKSQFGTDIAVTPDNFDASVAAARAAMASYRDVPISINGEVMTLNEAEAKLDQAQQELWYGQSQIQSGWAEYYAGQAALEQTKAEGEQKLADGQRQLDEARAKVAEGEKKVADAEAQLAKVKRYDWTVMPREHNAGAAQVSTLSAVTTNLSFSMAALFIIVGLLVSYSAVSRIVHEQITQIGTKKALGLREREITTSFLAYSALAVVSGSVIGTIVGIVAVEGIIGHALGGMFVFGDYPPHFGGPLFLAVTALELALVLGATWMACHGILREHAVELLKGEKPPEAKTRFYEKWALWNRLPLFTQTIVNNCANDKRRVFSTIVGVAGCTALIVTALTLNDDVLASYDRQYGDVYGFNGIVYVDPAQEGAADRVQAALQDHGARAAQVHRKTFALDQPNGERGAVTLIVPADLGAFDQVYHVRPIGGAAFDPNAEGAWVSQAYAHHMGAKVGDTLAIADADGREHQVPIAGFYEFWLVHYEAVMSADYYEREFGAAAVPNALLADSGDGALADVEPSLADVAGLASVTDDKLYQSGSFKTFSSVSRAVVLIYMALAILMAAVVLLNLNVMFIEEKKRELIVLMINGFRVKDVKRYIYNDTIVLTAVGIVCGLVLGGVMGSFTVGAIESSTSTFVKDVDWVAMAAGAAGSAALSLIMSVIALRRIPRFDLTDISRF